MTSWIIILFFPAIISLLLVGFFENKQLAKKKIKAISLNLEDIDFKKSIHDAIVSPSGEIFRDIKADMLYVVEIEESSIMTVWSNSNNHYQLTYKTYLKIIQKQNSDGLYYDYSTTGYTIFYKPEDLNRLLIFKYKNYFPKM